MDDTTATLDDALGETTASVDAGDGSKELLERELLERELLEDELLVEEISIDGMCGVY